MPTGSISRCVQTGAATKISDLEGSIPETENHFLMTTVSRYLTNQWLCEHGRCADELDNFRNGVRDQLLRRLADLLEHDFIEYNSRPYQRLSANALQVLFTHASDSAVKTLAQMVLDYVSAKVAVSSQDGRRNVPFRRLAGNVVPNLFGSGADAQVGRMATLAGTTGALRVVAPEEVREGYRGSVRFIDKFAESETLTTAVGSYRIPSPIVDLLINPQHRVFEQVFAQTAVEQYAATPSVLISAGGTAGPHAYKAFGVFTKDADLGVTVETTLLPAGFGGDLSELIRFVGRPPDDPNDVLSKADARANLCVKQGFACGYRPTVGAPYGCHGAGSRCCVRDDHADFIDAASPECRGAGPEPPCRFSAETASVRASASLRPGHPASSRAL